MYGPGARDRFFVYDFWRFVFVTQEIAKYAQTFLEYPQQWWSVSGGSRPPVSQLNLQPFAAWFFGEGWSVGYSGNILADWHAPSGDMWTVPVGLAIGKVVKLGRLPVKLQIAGQYMPVHPSEFGQEWNVQVVVTPVLPKLFKGTVF